MSDPGPARAPEPSAGHVGPGIPSVRGDIRGVRFLLYGCIALIVVLMLGLAVGLASMRTQLDDVRAQVAALGTPASAPPATDAGASSPQVSAAASLGAAAVLDGVELPGGADPTGAVLVGDPDATTVVETYIDYQCPYCQQWERSFGTALLERALQPGSGLLVKQYNLAFLGEANRELSPAGASARAASAAACVVDSDGAEVFAAFSRSLFQSADPSEPAGQFTAAALRDLATNAGASESAIGCIDAETYVPFVSAVTNASFGRGVTGTPTVVVDGATIGNAFSDPRIAELLTTS